VAYRILSLSGGGMRGIYQAEYLRAVAEDPDLKGRPLREYFHLIAGASTGAIIALGIALDVDLNSIVDLFHREGASIFRRPWLCRRGPGWYRQYVPHLLAGPRYDPEPLRRVLTKIFSDRRPKDCLPTQVAIVATRLDQAHPRGVHRVFTTFRRSPVGDPNPRNEERMFAVTAALASSAAPTYFPAIETRPLRPGGTGNWYIDGGVWANTPSLIAVIEALRWGKKDLAEMRPLSVGNGYWSARTSPHQYNRMSPRRVLLNYVRDFWFNPQSSAADDFAETLLTNEHMVRINPRLPQRIDLDDVKTSLRILPELAPKEAAETLPELKRKLQL
jgi:patatin-like phospholipase/acyl hydrolase